MLDDCALGAGHKSVSGSAWHLEYRMSKNEIDANLNEITEADVFGCDEEVETLAFKSSDAESC